MLKTLYCRVNRLFKTGVEHRDITLRVEALKADVELLDESLLLDDKVLAAELLDRDQSDQVGVEEG